MSHENEEALPEDDISDITVTHPNSVQNVQKVTAELTKAQKNIKSVRFKYFLLLQYPLPGCVVTGH